MEIQPHLTNVQLLLMSAKIASNEDTNKTLNYLDAAANILLKNCEGLPYGYEYLSELRPDLCLEIAKQRLMYSLNKSPSSDEVIIYLEEFLIFTNNSLFFLDCCILIATLYCRFYHLLFFF